MNFSNKLYLTITTSINEFELCPEGAGAYCPDQHYHAMADAKYLQAISSLYRCNRLSKGNFEKKCFASVICLSTASISLNVGTNSVAWGLGFGCRGLPANESYLITTALVVW